MNGVTGSTGAWLRGPLGQLLLEQEKRVAAAALECVFGVQCVQVGSWGEPRHFLDVARTQRRSLVAGVGTPGAALACSADALPLQSDSVDALILPHTLEFADDPHEVLREAGRVLTGEGNLLVLGFEPLGAWSLRHRLTRDGFPTGLRRTLSARRLADWLKLLGFEAGTPERYLYAPPFVRLHSGRAGSLFQSFGERLWPRLSGAYLLQARKRLYTLTPVRMRYRMRTAVIGGMAEPAARRAS